MKEIVEKLTEQEKIMAREKGPFDLFALFLREDAFDKWDLVVAAEWIEENKQDALKYIAEVLKKSLTLSEMMMLSRIAIIDEYNPGLKKLFQDLPFKLGNNELKDTHFFGLLIKHAFFITVKTGYEDRTPKKAIN